MSPMIFGTAFVVGAGAISVWIDARYPKLAPEEMGRILLHTFAAFIILRVAAGAVGPIAESVAVAAAFLVGLASIVYAFLVAIWAIRLFQGAYASLR